MPRGGSKKGMPRGNAKPRDGFATPNEIMRAAVKRPRAVAEKTGKKGPVGVNIPKARTVEADVQLSQLLHGRNSVHDLMPKEIVLNNMHRFYEGALVSQAMAQLLLSQPPTKERDEQIRALEIDEERLRLRSSDEAHKVMPFMHPRLVAIHSTNSGGETDMFQMILDEVDRIAREAPLVIEHIPQKKTA